MIARCKLLDPVHTPQCLIWAEFMIKLASLIKVRVTIWKCILILDLSQKKFKIDNAKSDIAANWLVFNRFV